MGLVKRLARRILRDELEAELRAARWQAVKDADANSAALLETLARVMRDGTTTDSVTVRKVRSLEEWDEGRAR